MYAAEEGNANIVDMLIKAGADVNAKDSRKHTALMNAINPASDSLFLGTLELLLNANADIDAQSDSNYTALMYAASFGQKETMELLLSRGANPEHKK